MFSSFRDRNYRIAIAIDFGTARSGYTYQFFEDKDVKEPSFRNKWPDTNEFYPKTLTEILFRPDGSVEAWGHSAKKRFTQLREIGEEKGYIFIDNFKTMLHEGADKDDKGIYIIKEEKKFYVLHLIAEFLKLVKDFALKDIELGLGGKGLLDESEIRWCLTVPAVWKDDSKQIMRRAAQKAGLIGEGSEDADRLLLVLEPEAAAVHCQQVMLRQNESAPLVVGKTIMIVDAGGGTVDITVHEVKDRGLDELIPCGGGLYGSKYIDKSFREFLDLKLSLAAMNEFQAQWPVEYTKLMGETWESIKCGYDADSKWRTSIDLPRRLERIIKDNYPQILEQLASDRGGSPLIRLTNEDMKEIFKPTIDLLIAEVKNQFTALEDSQCNILFLVGGFSESPLLKNRIQEEFSHQVDKIIIPEHPSIAIVLGAISLGIDPDIISRFSRSTSIKDLYENSDDPEKIGVMKELFSKIPQYKDNDNDSTKETDLWEGELLEVQTTPFISSEEKCEQLPQNLSNLEEQFKAINTENRRLKAIELQLKNSKTNQQQQDHKINSLNSEIKSSKTNEKRQDREINSLNKTISRLNISNFIGWGLFCLGTVVCSWIIYSQYQNIQSQEISNKKVTASLNSQASELGSLTAKSETLAAENKKLTEESSRYSTILGQIQSQIKSISSITYHGVLEYSNNIYKNNPGHTVPQSKNLGNRHRFQVVEKKAYSFLLNNLSTGDADFVIEQDGSEIQGSSKTSTGNDSLNIILEPGFYDVNVYLYHGNPNNTSNAKYELIVSK